MALKIQLKFRQTKKKIYLLDFLLIILYNVSETNARIFFSDKTENMMSKKCEICGKGPQVGNKVSHAHNLNKRRWLPNLQKVKVKINNAPRRIKVCTQCIKSGAIDQMR